MNAGLAGRTPDLVGRDAECVRVDSFVEALPHGARELVIRGEPGIGKTMLWRHAIGRCHSVGHRVLVTRPTEEEMSLTQVGLTDLFGEIDVDTGSLRDDDPLALGRAVLTALRELAGTGPAVVAIDGDRLPGHSAPARPSALALPRRCPQRPVRNPGA